MKKRILKERTGPKKRNISTYRVERKENLLDSLLTTFSGKKRKLIKAVLRDRQVMVEGKMVTQFDYVVLPGQDVTVSWDRIVTSNVPRELKIVHIDEDIIVLDKPPGILSVATSREKRKTIYSMLNDYVKTEDPDNRIYVVHKLDRETSGLMVFARSEDIKEKMQKCWRDAEKRRVYVAVVEGNVDPEEGRVTSWLTESSAFVVYSSKNSKAGKRAVTGYRKIDGNGEMSLVEITSETSRKHQIRVHMQDIGHSIVGDKKYGAKANFMGRMALHARILSFIHPGSGERCRYDSGVPRKFVQLFE